MSETPTADATTRPIAAFSNSYAGLPAQFFAHQLPAQVAQPKLVKFNTALAEELGLDIEAIAAQGAAGIFAGNSLPEGAEPIAMAYAGLTLYEIVRLLFSFFNGLQLQEI